MSVVLVNGARQVGKTTLARTIAAERGMRYLSLDDAATLSAARSDPVTFVQVEEPLVLDEIQKAPELLPAIKIIVDRGRAPGRFLLTGSADVLSLPRISESLAGRMEILTLWPLSQGEIEGTDDAFASQIFDPTPRVPRGSSDRSDIIARALRGGYPSAFRRTEQRRRAWFASYLTTILQRDIRDLADIAGLSALPQLLSLLAVRSATLLNVSELSRSSGIPTSTLNRYLALLEHTFLVRRIPAWSSNRSKRLVRSPKLAIVDTGLMAHLAGITSARASREPTVVGPLLESFVTNELQKQIGWTGGGQVFHYRTHAGREVDLVLEGGDGRVVGIEVKAAATVETRDVAGLSAFREDAGKRFVRGILLYTGTEVLPFGPGMYAMPMSALWSDQAPSGLG